MKDFFSSKAFQKTLIVYIILFGIISISKKLNSSDVWGIAQTTLELLLIPAALYGFERSIAEARKTQKALISIADLDLYWIVDGYPTKDLLIANFQVGQKEFVCPSIVMKNSGTKIARFYQVRISLPGDLKPVPRKMEWVYRNIERRNFLVYESRGESNISYPDSELVFKQFDLQRNYSPEDITIDYVIYCDSGPQKSGKLNIRFENIPLKIRYDGP